MSLTLYEFNEIDPISGDALYPPDRRKSLTLGQVYDISPQAKVLELYAVTDCHVSISRSSDVATTSDRRMDAGEQRLVTLTQSSPTQSPRYISAVATS